MRVRVRRVRAQGTSVVRRAVIFRGSAFRGVEQRIGLGMCALLVAP